MRETTRNLTEAVSLIDERYLHVKACVPDAPELTETLDNEYVSLRNNPE